MDTAVKVLFLLLGWLLGLLSPLITDAIKHRRERRETEAAIRVELKEVQFRLVGTIWLLATRTERFNRSLIDWMRPIVERYKGLNPTDGVVQTFKSTEGLTDEQLAGLARKLDPGPQFRLSLKKYSTPMIDSKISMLNGFGSEYQNLVLELKAVLNLLNEEVDQFRFYFNQTFISSLSEKNRVAIAANIETSYATVFNGAQRAVDLIERILAK